MSLRARHWLEMDFDFHSTHVAPFYGALMNANFLREDAQGFSETLKEALPSFSEGLLREMVHSSWRAQKVAAWVIGLEKVRPLEPDLAQNLHTLKGDHAEHLVMGLVLIHSEETVGHLEEFLDCCFQRNDLTHDSLDHLSTSVGWALAALEILRERTHQKEPSSLHYLEDEWHRFPHRWMEQMSVAGGRQGILERAVADWHSKSLERYREDVTEILMFCETRFGVSL